MLLRLAELVLFSLGMTSWHREAENLPVVGVFFGLLAVSLGGLVLTAPDPSRIKAIHQFADQRTIFGIPNFWNVVSNLPLPRGGAPRWLRRFRDDPATVVFFLGVFLTGIGSSYYHWDPNDGTLFWDRLPMTLSFAALLALVVEERVNARAGAILLWPALAVGLFQPLVVALERRPAALLLGAVLSWPRSASAVFAVPT